MNRNNGKNLAPPREENTDDLLSMTDSDDSSSSSKTQVFDNQALVLELHELQRDELPDNPLPEVQVKTRKLAKKRPKPGQQQPSAASLTSSSESSVAPPGAAELPPEEFFDAQGSYHGLPENRSTTASAISTLVIAASQQDDGAKVHSVPETTALMDAATTASVQQTETETPAPQPTAISKPTEPTNPE